MKMAPDRKDVDSAKPNKWYRPIAAQTLVDCNYNYKLNETEKKLSMVKKDRSPSGLLVGLIRLYQRKWAFTCFMTVWMLFSIAALWLNAVNVNWSKMSVPLGVAFVTITTLLHANIFESVLIAAVAILMGGHRRPVKTAPFHHLTLLINYNILAVYREDIDETMDTMYSAYMSNLSLKTSCVLVSATSDPVLKRKELEVRDNCRKLIYRTLYDEGLNFIQGRLQLVNELHRTYVWSHYSHVPPADFIDYHLHGICQRFADEFMVVHRVSRVLKKCGQYQDLMLLSEGDSLAYSYTDPDLYGKYARPYGEPLFHASEDVRRILGRRFDYTLVLDGDTVVPEGHCYELMSVAAANPDEGLIQPDIRIVTNQDDTVFMRIECLRQHLSGPTANAMVAVLGQVSFFGKGLIKNRIYVDRIIGRREKPLELIPVDVLSHDTYEAACLKPFYAGSVYLVEAPCRNYITWNIRETRWNTGDIILGVHFWPRSFGLVVRSLQKFFQKENYKPVNVRTVPHFDLVTSYISHAAIRHMSMKLFLFIYLLLRNAMELHNPDWPNLGLTFFILLFPKFAVYNGRNLRLILIEILISFLQFSPDVFAGVFRFFVALRSILQNTPKWIPQRAIEEQFQQSNNFLQSFRELWLITITALLLCVVSLTQSYTDVSLHVTTDYVIFIITALALPFYCGFTSSRIGPFAERLLKLKN